MKFALRWPVVADPQQQDNNEDIMRAFNLLAQFIDAGSGAPTGTPNGPRLYFRTDTPEVYKYNGAWVVI